MNIGEKIRSKREDMDLSQRDVADMIPMNQSNYSKIERDLQEPSLDQLRRICLILKLDPRSLLDIDVGIVVSEQDFLLLAEVKNIINRYQLEK